MERVLEGARMAAATDAAILIVGETGTGKEMLARAIHQANPRARMPFVALNCGALPRELVESELFGFRRGAFTGAYNDAPGIFSAASGGTVFLDEIGEMAQRRPGEAVARAARRRTAPGGQHQEVHVDVRVVSATNRPLNELRSALLREDLYFRIATVGVQVPPLRARQEDILVLTQHFAARLSCRYGREISLSRSALELLLRYPFPGNVRELESLIESASAVSADNPQSITTKT
jgi:two-component system response regulator PilR (NtrC family)